MIQMLDLKRMGDRGYMSEKLGMTNGGQNSNNMGKGSNEGLDDSLIGIGSVQETQSKKGMGTSNFRVKGGNNTRTNSNAFLM